MANVKKARQLAEEIIRCEKVISNSNSSKDDVAKAKSKIQLIAKAYSNNSEMMFTIIGEADKIAAREFQK